MGGRKYSILLNLMLRYVKSEEMKAFRECTLFGLWQSPSTISLTSTIDPYVSRLRSSPRATTKNSASFYTYATTLNEMWGNE